jgi:hypothetical protein
MTSLYELAAGFASQSDALTNLDLDAQTIEDTLESLTGPLEEKAQNVAYVERNMVALAAQIKDAEAQMAVRRKALENRAARLREYMLACLILAGVKKIEGPRLRLTVKDNPPAVDVFDQAQVPAQFMRVPEPPPPAPDKVAIKIELKAGHDVPGCRLVQGKRMEISA